jgi:hypothetical protein
MRLALIVLATVAMLAGCTTLDQPETPPPPASAGAPQTAEEATQEDTCGMAAFRHLIGTPASAIDRASLPPRTRIITPDSMVTQDFAPGRLNIFTGTDGKVSSLRCF